MGAREERLRQGQDEEPAREGGVQSLMRALSILDALADSDDGLTLTVLARKVGLPPSSAHRLLTTLQRKRFVRFDGAAMAWHVGVQAFVVGNAFARSRDVVALAEPYMRPLMEECGETVNLYVRNRDEAICMAQVQSREMIRAISRPGGGVGMNRSAAGKAMLAHLLPSEVAEIIARNGMSRATRNTIVSIRRLNAELAKTRMRGFALDNEEFAVGLRCVAAPIFDERGTAYAALSIAGPLARMADSRLPLLGDTVAATARSVTAELGGAPPSLP
jgi:IclR family acetate operon transcriptional repressor